MSAQQLADACDRLGHPVPRSVLTNLENGRREAVSVPELLALAAALGVAPALLVFPVGTAVPVEMLPGQVADPWRGYRWFVGDPTPSERMEGTNVVDAFRRHDQAVAGYLSFREANPDAAQAYLNSLTIAREDIRRNRWNPPPIPSGLAADVAAEEARLLHEPEVWDEQLDGGAS